MNGNGLRKLPIGVQGFPSLRGDGFVYVDKTEYIYKLTQGSRQYFLFRPRRFGKSLLLSTMRAYFEGKKELFKGLAIERLVEGDADAWRPYPVFYFDFNKDSYQKNGILEDVLEDHIKEWEKVYGSEDPEALLSERFRSIIRRAVDRTGRRVVILVDEYDKPLLEVMKDPELEEHNKAVFKGFFSTLKSYDDYIRFVFITGVTKFSKVSIFSDLNQLYDISMVSDYAGICGITGQELPDNFEPEIERLAAQQELSKDECLARLKEKYDGYRFHQSSEGVYNPFSLLNCFANMEFGDYWFETGTPTFLVKRLREIGFDVASLSDRTLTATGQELSDYRGDNLDPVPLLYQTGYLTIADYDPEFGEYILGFPNEEVRYGFLRSLMPEYAPVTATRSGKDISSIRRYLMRGDTERMRGTFTALFASIPYTTKDVPFEHDFQTVIYLVFTLLGQYVHTEVHSAEGRADCIVETDAYVYIFEFKRDGTADEALSQIEEKGYAAPYAADSRRLIRVGVSFDSEKRILKEWKTIE